MINERKAGLTHSSNANLIGTRKSFYMKKSSTPTGQVDASTVYFSAPYFVISSSCFCFVFETKCINQSQQNYDSLGRCFLKHSHISHIFWSTNFFRMDLFASYNSVVSQSSVRFIKLLLLT